MNDNVFYEFEPTGKNPILLAYLEFTNGMMRAVQVGRFTGFDNKGNPRYEEMTPQTVIVCGSFYVREYRGALEKSAESTLNEAKKGISAAIAEATSPFKAL